MLDISTSRDTVAIDEAVHGIYKSLTDADDLLASPFRTMKDVFMWAASLGYKHDRRQTLSGKRTTIFRWSQFNEQTDVPLIKAMAISAEQDITVLQSQNRLLDIVEEYANSGIHLLKQGVIDQPGQPLWNLVNLSRR